MRSQAHRRRRRHRSRRRSGPVVLRGAVVLQLLGAVLLIVALGMYLNDRREADAAQRAQHAAERPAPTSTFEDMLPASEGTPPAASGLSIQSGGLTAGGLDATATPTLPAHLKHDLVITVRSADPIGRWAFWIPTSDGKKKGERRTQSTTDTLRTTVYGNGDYAQVYVQAGYHGTAVTCTITVDGNVTSQRTAKGQFKVAMCQG